MLQKDRNHPAEKPVELLKKLILKHKQTAEMLVLDPYMGSGSVAVASKECGVNFIGFELDKTHCETANSRANGEIQLPLAVNKKENDGLPPTSKEVGIRPTIL